MCDNARNSHSLDYEELGFPVMPCWFLGKTSSYVGPFLLFYVYTLTGHQSPSRKFVMMEKVSNNCLLRSI